MSLLSPPLQAFAAVARVSTVHGAARELGITQTGVTQRIRGLERQLGATLFIRSRRGMRLTPEGEALLRYCEASSELEGEALARISGQDSEREARICVVGPTSLMRSRVIPSCKPVLQGAPRLAVAFQVTDLENRDQLLRTGQAQLALLPPEQVGRELDSKLLRPERYVLVGPRDWKKRSLEDVVRSERIIDFDPTDQMTFAYLRKHRALGNARSERHFVNNTESLVDLIEAGLGYGVLTEEFAEAHLARGRVALLNSGSALEVRHALAWYPRPHMPDYLSRLIRAIR